MLAAVSRSARTYLRCHRRYLDSITAQFWLAPFTAHEEREKRRNWFFLRPAVHHGFQRSWRANGLSRRVVGRVSQIAAEAAKKGQRLRVITTGAVCIKCRVQRCSCSGTIAMSIAPSSCKSLLDSLSCS